MPPRYIIGLELPRKVFNSITVIQNKYYDDKLLLRPQHPHITIVQSNTLQAISPLWLLPKIKPLINRYFTLYIEIGELSIFNNSVLHFKINSPELISLQTEIIDLLPPDIRGRNYVGQNSFSPHVTIAQAKPRHILSQYHLNKYINALNEFKNTEIYIKSLSKFERSASSRYQTKTI